MNLFSLGWRKYLVVLSVWTWALSCWKVQFQWRSTNGTTWDLRTWSMSRVVITPLPLPQPMFKKNHQLWNWNEFWQLWKNNVYFVVQYIIEMLDNTWLLGRAIWRLQIDGCFFILHCLHYCIQVVYHINPKPDIIWCNVHHAKK